MGKQHLPLRRQECSIGGNAYAEAAFSRHAEKTVQRRMEEGLPHHVKIQVVGVRSEPLTNRLEFSLGHLMQWALRARAKAARKVTDVSDLDVNAIELPLLRHCSFAAEYTSEIS